MSAFIEATNNNIEYFLNEAVFLDMKDSEGSSLLHYSIRGGADDVSLYLLKNHINTNIINNRNETAIFEAVRKGNKEIIVKIINNFGKINLRNIYGETPLHLASKTNNLDIIKLLIENKANIYDRTSKGESILFYSVLSGNVNIFKYLCKLSPRLSKIDRKQNTLLHVASTLDNVKMVKHLLSINENPHLKNSLGETPLFIAVKEGYTDLVGLLIKKGAYIDVINKYNESLFDLSSVKENETLKELLNFYLNSALNKKNIKKHPLRHAVITRNLEEVEKLLLNGYVDYKDEYNLSAYCYAKLNKDKKIISLFDNIKK